MDRGNYVAAAMKASLAAGPAFLGSMAVAAWATDTPTTYVFDLRAEQIGGLTLSLVVVIPFGFLLSGVPNLIGAWFMHGLGIGNFAARLPVAWALAGAAAAGMPFAFANDWSSQAGLFATAFTMTGAICALVAQRYTTWRDPIARGARAG